MNDQPAVFDDTGPDVRAAAETLREVDGLRRRSETLAKARAFPLWVWAGTFAAALPVAAFTRRTGVSEVTRGADGITFISLGGSGDFAAIAYAVVVVAAVVAAAVSIIDYRRQPVHRARERRRQISVGEGIVLAAALVILGPVALGAFFMVAMSPSMAFVGASVIAILVGMHMGNRALSLAGVTALFGILPAPFIWSDHWPALAVGSYVLMFSIGGLCLTLAQRKSR
ncbi:MAG: hypothetical protein WEB06_04715 [Actinomycetota bacterium]